MFGISKSEIEERMAAAARKEVVQHHEVELKKFGTVVYDGTSPTGIFYPALQLEQDMRRTGQQ